MKLLKKLIIFSISGILLFYLVKKIDLTKTLFLLKQINWFLLITIIPVIILIYLVRIKKLNFLLKTIDINIAFFRLSKIFLIGIFYGLITPGKLGEFGRVYYFHEAKSKTLPALLWEKLIDVFTLILLSNITIFLLFKNLSLLYLSLILTALFLIFVFLLMNKKMMFFVLALFKVPNEKQEDYMETMLKIFKKEILLKIFAFSLLYLIICFIAAFILLKSMDPSASPFLIFSLPLLIIFGNLPITVSGLGLREFITIYYFTLLGSTAEFGFSFSIIWFILTALLPGLIGYFFIIRR